MAQFCFKVDHKISPIVSCILALTSRLPLISTGRCLSTSMVLGTRANTKKPRHPHWERSKLLAIGRPQFTPSHPDSQYQWQDCNRQQELAEEEAESKPNAFEMLYVDEFRSYLEKSRLIAIFHTNQILHHPERRVSLKLSIIVHYRAESHENIDKRLFKGSFVGLWSICFMYDYDRSFLEYSFF